MDSWLILRSKRVILNQWTKRNFSKASSIWCLFPSDKRSWMFRRQVQHSMESAHHFSSRPDCNNTAEVPSFALRAALSAIPFVSDRCGVDVQWFQERSSQALPNSKELSVLMTFGSLSGSRYFCKLLWVSCEVCVLHGYDWIHWVAKSCTTTAYRWLFRNSLRTLWSAIIKSPKFSARSTTPPMRLLHGALVILVFWQISQFRSFGKWV